MKEAARAIHTSPSTQISAAPGSFLARFREATAAKTPAERAAYLEDPPDASVDITSSHAVWGQEEGCVPSLLQDCQGGGGD